MQIRLKQQTQVLLVWCTARAKHHRQKCCWVQASREAKTIISSPVPRHCLHQAPSLTARGQAVELHLSFSHPCKVLDPQLTTRFSSGLSGLLSWKYSTAFWILSMQLKYSSSLPVGLKIKPEIKCRVPRRKETRYQESTRANLGWKITKKTSIPFSSLGADHEILFCPAQCHGRIPSPCSKMAKQHNS